MPAIPKIATSIHLIVMLLLLHQMNGFRDQSMEYSAGSYSTNREEVEDFESVNMRWRNTADSVRRTYVNIIMSMLPRIAMMVMTQTNNVSKNCTYSFYEYIKGLRNMKTWSYKMLDATGKLPTGILTGNSMSFGDYDTCLEITAPSRRFKGQYCYVELHMPLPKRRILTPVELPVNGIHGMFEDESLIGYIANKAGYLYSSQLRLTTCLPSTCSTEDVRNIYLNGLKYLNFEFQVKVPHCETNDVEKQTALEIFIFILFGLIICLVIFGTLQDILLRNTTKDDIETAEKSVITKTLLCFSAYTNFMRLISVSDNPDTLRIFYGIRVFSMLWIQWSHAHFPFSYKIYDSALSSMDMRTEFTHQLMNCGFLAVETFFFMSSVLVAYICVRIRGRISIPQLFLKRYLRLTPTLMLVTAFFAVVGRFGSGPLWYELVANSLSKKCLERGWLNLFYINNYLYSTKRVCLGWTWYLSTDTQMFLVSLSICVILRKKLTRGFLAIGLMLIAGVVLTFYSHVYYNLPPFYLLSYLNFDDWYYFSAKGHTPLHLHLSVGAIGLAVGYVLATRKGHIPKHINIIGWTLSPIVFFTILYLSYKWNQGVHALPSVFVSALYGSLHRVAWALSLAFMTLSCTWGQGGIANSILCWEGFVPFARLTYLVFLLHYGLLEIQAGGLSRQSMTFNHRTLSFVFFNNVSTSYLLALALSLCFESPFTALEKAFSDGKLKKKIQPVSAIQGTIIVKP